MIINGLKALPPAQGTEAMTQIVDELLKWDNNIAKVQGKKVKTVGNPSENQTANDGWTEKVATRGVREGNQRATCSTSEGERQC
ncbi:hypothetical protein MtrunA17_Chr6g0458481 [Medicago truncatula]|uniref:Uncharacterized protein n=1 Tax=Medicago truncatula TaxID=3880 RepID=A0A396HFD5_MEDTR|nr:hypothetical protein MtrunA17_Chr6g0458481 [Medicago truncatula]